MARAKYNPAELDQNFQIEDAIRKTLCDSPTAEVSAAVIEFHYDLLDERCDPVNGAFVDKCKAIAKIVGADFSLCGKNVVFKNAQGGKHHVQCSTRKVLWRPSAPNC